MYTDSVWVPFPVLNAPNHSANTRLIWVLESTQEAGLPEGRLRRQSGLDSRTIAVARARLMQAPLVACYTRPYRTCAEIPAALLTDGEIAPGARLLYGQLQGVPDFDHPKGSFTYAALSQRTGTSEETLRRAASRLVAAGWLTVTQKNRKSPIVFTLCDPVEPQVRARINAIRRKVKDAQYRGETLMREFLKIMIAGTESDDDATPDFLLNPFTDQLMEFDRYYPTEAVAFEFNGAQHYEETEIATFAETVKQVARDAMKAFIARSRGIELVYIHPADLSLAGLAAKLPGRLPRRDLDGMAPVLKELDAMATNYRESSAQKRVAVKLPSLH